MGEYIHQRGGWPAFRWDDQTISNQLAEVRHRQGRLIGRMEALGFPLRAEAMLATLTEDVLKSSEIEGEHLDREQVRTSLARRLGMEIGALAPADRNVEGIVEMMLDATQRFAQPLTEHRLFAWHAALFPTGRSGMSRIIVGGWRDDARGPMQVISGPIGLEHVHFEAPEARRVPAEMRGFLSWLDGSQNLDPVLKAAIAHLWFVTVHPFEDGNGRIARAIADMALARSEQSPQRFYSMSAQIRVERKSYYEILEATQRGDLDITPWLKWFLDCLARAIEQAENTLSNVLAKAHFWESHTGKVFNTRQLAMIDRLLNGFDVKLTSSKWAAITKVSQDTALRDITDLIELGILARNEGGGRSTGYSLKQIV